MSLRRALPLFIFFAIAALASPLHTSATTQSTVKPPPSLKVPKSSDLPPSSIQRRYDRAKNTTYVTIDIPLSAPSRDRSLRPAAQSSAGEIDLSFQLAYKGAAATDLSAASLTISFVNAAGQVMKPGADTAVELQADAYEYRYQEIDYQTEKVTGMDTAALEKEQLKIDLPLEDLQQLAFANRLQIKIGNKELQVKSIQLAELRQTIFSHNANR